MMSPRSERTPLLADSPRNSEESTRAAEEEDAALHGGNAAATLSSSNQRRRGLREVLLFVWAVIATAGVIVLAVILQHRNATSGTPSPISPGDPSAGGPYTPTTTTTTTTTDTNARLHSKKRNLIFMVSDGMGPASLSLTRSFRQHVQSLPASDVLTLDAHFWGTSRTRSTNSLVTDSAAGATAFSCGRKSYNGAIAMLDGHRPCGTVLEAAKRKGFRTGLVVTTDVTDATPASFAAHVDVRWQMDEIALHEVGAGPLGRSVDLILGGGRCHFLGNGTRGSCRNDDLDVVGLARDRFGWAFKGDRQGFDELQLGRNATLPLLGLFADADVPFEIDRRNMADVYPSLSEMATTALTVLDEATKHADHGFFLMIEGSRIDHAGHFNDPAAQVREVLEYDKTFKIVLDYLAKSDTEGVLVATSDHETGGLSTAWQAPGEAPVYDWYPAVLAKANASAEHLTRLLNEHVAANPGESEQSLKDWINKELVVGRLGITDALETELAALAADPAGANPVFCRIVSTRAHIGWSTHGHSAVDVNIYSSGGPAAEKIRGNVENTDIGKFLSEYLDVDVDAITKELEGKFAARRGGAEATAETKPGAAAEGFAVLSGHRPAAQRFE
ncbi:alkaline-phosphatase-like protein [Thermothelomyces heterothallicus CBS 202.75]|uniref:alkaline-phosphatase-like protein n=1 Tax=Thermothelomyces heterothallicus CBS 202.75 TaxID=1149848 RepID=UPI0037426CCD